MRNWAGRVLTVVLLVFTCILAAVCLVSLVVPLGIARQHEYLAKYPPLGSLSFITARAVLLKDCTLYVERGSWGVQSSGPDMDIPSSVIGIAPMIEPGPTPPIPLTQPVERPIGWDPMTKAPKPYDGALWSFPFWIVPLIPAAGLLAQQALRRRRQRNKMTEPPISPAP